VAVSTPDQTAENLGVRDNWENEVIDLGMTDEIATTESDEQTDIFQRFLDFFKSYRTESGSLKYREMIQRLPVTGGRSVIVDFNELLAHDPQLARQIIDEPENCLKPASDAVKTIVDLEDRDYVTKIIESGFEFKARLRNVSTGEVKLRMIRASHIGKLIMVRGIVTRVSEVKPQLVVGIFECTACGEKIEIPQVEGRYTPPSRCTNPKCGREGPFILAVEDSKFVDWQKLRIQEMPEELPPGQMPRSIDIIVKDDLVDTARPGDRVAMIGVLISVQDFAPRRGRLTTFRTFIDANYVDTMDKESEKVEITPEEERVIADLAKDEWIYQKIIKSIAPSIYGLEDIKEAIALALFGGVPKTLPDGVKIRGEINVLLVGDPGTAKSQLLMYTAELAPRGLYTSGKGSTAAGLTAAVLRDADTGDMTLEAGALVLADRGVACVDEFDKMNPQDRVAIHQAMEQQTISIAKAGIVATLNARTAILAAANPAFGRYNTYKNPAENISLPVTVLSRFDLIFVIMDKPESERDKRMAEHVLSLHSSKGAALEAPIFPQLLKKYISYAKRNFTPTLTPEASKKIQEFYLETRAMGENPESPVPITARQLEALVRLAEARAKMGLKKEITVEDADAVIRLMNASLKQVGIDTETGRSDIDTIMVGRTKSQRERIDLILRIVNELSGTSKEGFIPVQKIIDAAISQGVEEQYAKDAVDKLLKEGVLFSSSKPGFVKKV
jgi:replicative DNA helicase Mcm